MIIEEQYCDHEIIEKLGINENKTSEGKRVLFKNHKHKRGVEYRIYTDRLIEIKTTFLSRMYGLRLPNELHKFFKIIPKNKSVSILTADFVIVSKTKKILLSNIVVEVVSRIDYFTGRDNIKRPIKSLYLKPVKSKQFSYLKKLLKEDSKLFCRIDKVFQATDFYLKIEELMRQTPNLNDSFSKSNLVICGGLQNSKFEIYIDEQGFLLIKLNTIIYKTGKITISEKIRNIIPNVTNYEFVVCKRDDDQPIIVPFVIRNRKDDRQLFEINLPHYAFRIKKISILFTHPNYMLHPSIIEDYKMKCLLNQQGYEITSFNSNYIAGQHWDKAIERKMRNLTRKAFENEDVKLYSEAQLIINKNNKNNLGSNHTFDEIIYDEKNKQLIIIEYKTSFGRNAKFREIDSAIAELFHFKRKIKGETVLILIINDDLSYKGKIITKTFGEKMGILLIGKNELDKLYEQPKSLLEIIKDFLQKKDSRRKSNTIVPIEKTALSQSILKFEDSNVLLNNRQTILNKIPLEFYLRKMRYNNCGIAFEKEVEQVLLAEGFEVISNVLIRHYNRYMEIDLLCFKDNKLLIASCRDASTVNCLMSLKSDIKQKACKLEHRQFVLNADYARFYIKVNSEVYKKVKDFEGKWVDSVEIIFVVI